MTRWWSTSRASTLQPGQVYGFSDEDEYDYHTDNRARKRPARIVREVWSHILEANVRSFLGVSSQG